MDITARWLEISEAVRMVELLEQRLLLLPLSLAAKAGDDQALQERISRIKHRAGLTIAGNAEFCLFFRNWKSQFAEAYSSGDRRALLKWLLRKVHHAVSQRPVI